MEGPHQLLSSVIVAQIQPDISPDQPMYHILRKLYLEHRLWVGFGFQEEN